MSDPPLIIEAIVDQHAEEAAFLWLLRDAAVRAPHYDLSDLFSLDDRVEAHIDGLRIAGDPGWEVCAKGLEAPSNLKMSLINLFINLLSLFSFAAIAASK